jgi:alanyl aminopeptidase
MTLKQVSLWFLLLLSVSANTFATETDYRLSKHIKPSFQKITLRIDPDQPTFSGESTITIDVTKAT